MEASNTNPGLVAMPVPAATVPPPRRRRRLRMAGIAVAVLALVLMLAHFAWRASGSNEWVLADDEAGVKVWTLKAPGSSLIKVKGTVRVKSRLAGMVKLLEDLSSCVDAQCYDGKVIETMPAPDGRHAAYVRFKYDVPGLRTQDFVLLLQHVQDPATKVLDIALLAAPDRIPRDECCARITHLHNTWRIAPRPGGELDIEFTQDTDIEGMPYPLVNLALRMGTLEILQGMQNLMDMEKYRTAPVGIVSELPNP